MLNKSMSLFLALGLSFSSVAYADCSISPRLKVDSIVNDVALYALGVDSLSKTLLTEKGYDTYDEYTYSSETFSNAILQIQNNHKTIGSLYTNALKARLKEKEPSMAKAFEKVLAQCSSKELKEVVTKGVWSTLSGTNRTVERELMQLNLNALSDGMKNI